MSLGADGEVEVVFDTHDSKAGWLRVLEELGAYRHRLDSDVLTVMKQAAQIVFEHLNRYPVEMHYNHRSGLLLWRAGSLELALEIHRSGSAAWTLSRHHGFAYRDRDGVGLGKEFELAAKQLKRELITVLS